MQRPAEVLVFVDGDPRVTSDDQLGDVWHRVDHVHGGQCHRLEVNVGVRGEGGVVCACDLDVSFVERVKGLVEGQCSPDFGQSAIEVLPGRR